MFILTTEFRKIFRRSPMTYWTFDKKYQSPMATPVLDKPDTA